MKILSKHISTIIPFIVCLFLTSCIPLGTQSRLVTKNIQIGMTKNEVRSRIGQPYKIASELGPKGRHYDSWFYKEKIWTGYEDNFTIQNILIFSNDILIEIKQGEEVNDRPIRIETISTEKKN